MMRVFISISLSDRIKESAGQVMTQMKKSGAKGRYTDPENMHLTLAFIGETNDVSEIMEALDQVNFHPFRIVTEGFGHFGNLFWMGLRKEPALTGLVRKIKRALSDQGISYDRKSFKAHITLARKVSAPGVIKVRVPAASMEVHSFSLMRSERIKGKMKYTELAVWEAQREPVEGALCLESRRLWIRKITEKDKQDYLYGLSLVSDHKEAYQDEEIAGMLWNDVLHDPDSVTMVMYDKDSGKVTGTCSFDYWLSDYPEIGINVDPALQSQGLGTEAVRTLIKAFQSLRPEGTLLIRTKKNNLACRKMIEKCGGIRVTDEGNGTDKDLLSYTLVTSESCSPFLKEY